MRLRIGRRAAARVGYVGLVAGIETTVIATSATMSTETRFGLADGTVDPRSVLVVDPCRRHRPRETVLGALGVIAAEFVSG
jgi:hypothetical protein